jgi:hypothetical protein
MKLILFIGILILTYACSSKDKNYYFKTDVIEIVHYSIPDSMNLFDTAHIEAKSEEPNGCWRDLNFVLSKSTDTIYRLKAFGTFEGTGGVCPTVIVSKDTIINFIPTRRGMFIFYINQPTTTILDTLQVK